VEALGSQRREDSSPSGRSLSTIPTDAAGEGAGEGAGEDAGERNASSQGSVANNTTHASNRDATSDDVETRVGSAGHRRPLWRTCLIFWLRWVQISMEKSLLLWLWTGGYCLTASGNG
jgi:hypothetical protein